MLSRASVSVPVTDFVSNSAGHAASMQARNIFPNSSTDAKRAFAIAGSGILVAIAPAVRAMAVVIDQFHSVGKQRLQMESLKRVGDGEHHEGHAEEFGDG